MPSTRFSTAAYRLDIVAHGGPFGVADSAWLAVGSLLEHAAATRDEARDTLARDAGELAREVVGHDAMRAFEMEEWELDTSDPTAPIFVLVKSIAEAGALNLAAAMLDSAMQATTDSPLRTGRALAYRARLAWKRGDLDEAGERYELVEAMGRQHRLAELRIRADIGRGALAQMRGNYPEVRRLSLRALRAAQKLHRPRLERMGAYGVIRAAAAMADVDEALGRAWQVYMMDVDDDLAAAESLQTLGQLLLEAGEHHAARAAFAAVSGRPLPSRVLLPALGGLAVASAHSGKEATVEWASREITRLRSGALPGYNLASALLDCATAFALLRRTAEADECRRRALDLSQKHGFHELVYRAELLAERPAPAAAAAAPLGRRGAAVARSVAAMEPASLPSHVTLIAAAPS